MEIILGIILEIKIRKFRNKRINAGQISKILSVFRTDSTQTSWMPQPSVQGVELVAQLNLGRV